MSSILLHVTVFHSLLWLNDTALCACSTFPLSINRHPDWFCTVAIVSSVTISPIPREWGRRPPMCFHCPRCPLTYHQCLSTYRTVLSPLINVFVSLCLPTLQTTGKWRACLGPEPPWHCMFRTIGAQERLLYEWMLTCTGREKLLFTHCPFFLFKNITYCCDSNDKPEL